MKVFLHGGKASFNCHENITFREKIASDVSEGTKLLMCYFSSDESNWQKYFENDRKLFQAISPQLEMVPATKDRFVEQLENASVLFLSGGDSFSLIDTLKKYTDLSEILANKIVVGVSAGACALSTYFYSNDEQRTADGLGLIRAKVYCHYRPDLNPNIEKLKAYKENLPIIALPEHHSVILF